MRAKDEQLASLADVGNVAQFCSFSPDNATPRFHRIAGVEDSARLSNRELILSLFNESSDRSVNIRAFSPSRNKGAPFVFGLTDPDAVLHRVRELGTEGFYTIVNETIDTHDGGVSGVVLGGIVEFAPDDTPRAVEKPDVASMPRSLARRVLGKVYGFEPDWRAAGRSKRLEFSVHPRRVGYRGSHTLWWELEAVSWTPASSRIGWPNRFSRHIGDKAYGLLVAASLGLPVPRSTVVSRRIAPFTFGKRTGSAEFWLRTCPTEQQPGLFPTTSHWVDPYELLQRVDPAGQAIASVIAQEGVEAKWSGASIPLDNGLPDVRGVAGGGESFMLGAVGPQRLPAWVASDVESIVARAEGRLRRRVRTEWVHDGSQPWVVQLHVSEPLDADGAVISPGDATSWVLFDSSEGLESLRALIVQAQRSRQGVRVRGNVGVASHVGDLLRKAKVPARFDRT